MTLRIKILAIIVLAATNVAATQFRTQRLAHISKAISILNDSVDISFIADSVFTYNGKELNIKVNEYNEVSHIGYKLFNDSIVTLQTDNKPVFEFIERYLLELDLMLDNRTPFERMALDRVTLAKGTINMLKKIDKMSPVIIEEIPRRMFRFTWIIDNNEVSLTFPSSCQLILGADLIELENLAEKNILRLIPLTANDIIQNWESSSTNKSQGLRVIEGGFFISEMVRADIFLEETKGKLRLLCNINNPIKSVSNIMTTGIYEKELPTSLVLKKYGHKTDTLSISLQQFISFCKKENCKIFFGVKSMKENNMSCTLFAFNEKMSYNHILSIIFPLDILLGKIATIKSKAYLYIPLHDIKEEFFDQFKKVKK